MLKFIVIVLNVIDLIQTYYILKIDVETEGNKIIQKIYNAFGFKGVIAIKAIVIFFVLLCSSPELWILFIMYVFIVGWNFVWFYGGHIRH